MNVKYNENSQRIAYLIMQLVLVLILCLLPKDLVVSSTVTMLLLAAVLLIHSNKMISYANWTNLKIFNFIVILVTIFFIPAYAAFRSTSLLIVGLAIIIANVLAIVITMPPVTSVSKVPSISKSKQFLGPATASRALRINKKLDKPKYKIVAVVGGSKFHSLDCKMVENKSKKRLEYFISAHEAQAHGLKPCKLCKAVSYLHQF